MVKMENKEITIYDEEAVNKIVDLINIHKSNAYRKVNEELISLYFEVGKYLSEKVETANWSSNVIGSLAIQINSRFPGLKGFNRPGLYRMMQFYDTYSDNEKVSTLLRQINWSSHLLILAGTETMEEKFFYMQMCIKMNKIKVIFAWCIKKRGKST